MQNSMRIHLDNKNRSFHAIAVYVGVCDIILVSATVTHALKFILAVNPAYRMLWTLIQEIVAPIC